MKNSKEPKAPKEDNAPPEPNAPKNKEPKVPKAPKDPKPPKEPKAPKLPKTKEPKTPKAPKDPKSPKEPKEPKTPKTKEPKPPKTKEPKPPKTKEPKPPKTKEPKTPKTKEPKPPKTKEPKPPKEPKTPKTKEPKEPKEPKTANALKKRGRKPKGGKIINTTSNTIGHGGCEYMSVQPVSNIIMHLKCNYNDLPNTSLSCFTYEPILESIESYTDCNISDTAYKITNDEQSDEYDNGCGGCGIINTDNDAGDSSCCVQADTKPETNALNYVVTNSATSTYTATSTASATATIMLSAVQPKSQLRINNKIDDNNSGNANLNSASFDLKEIWKKINKLKVIFHKDGAHHAVTQRSACFWCTYEFETPTIHIPTLYNKPANTYTVYGCFCSPECATAHLMKELIDTSVRFERFQLLQAMYSKIYNYDAPFKPAPDPHYLLNKFYGNLSIEEYRKLLKSDHMLYIVNKPLMHSLPELYEDNNEFMVSNKITIQNTMTKAKKT